MTGTEGQASTQFRMTQEEWAEVQRIGKQLVQASIKDERERQDEKWGEQNHDDDYWFIIESEELGEVAKAILGEGPDSVRREIVQVVAVGIAWLEAIERRKNLAVRPIS